MGVFIFKCDKCGLCCKNLKNNNIYSYLDRGDGVCYYFDEITNLCKIYDNRPIICNVEKAYNVFFSNRMSYEEYIKLNTEACKKIKNRE